MGELNEFDAWYSSEKRSIVLTVSSLEQAFYAGMEHDRSDMESSRYEALKNTFDHLQRDYNSLKNEHEMMKRNMEFVLKRNETMSSGIEAMAMVFGENMFKRDF